MKGLESLREEGKKAYQGMAGHREWEYSMVGDDPRKLCLFRYCLSLIVCLLGKRKSPL